MSSAASPYRADVERAISFHDLSTLRRVFLIGSGFVGSWLLEVLNCLGVETIVLVRDRDKFRDLHPWLSIAPHVRLHVGDIQSFTNPEDAFGCDVIHAALPDHSVTGLTHVLCAARNLGARRFLLVSSGVSGDKSSFGQEKARAEKICQYADSVLDLEVRIARGWTFAGPWLSSRYAVSRFVRAAIANEPLRICGTGDRTRSYLYGADMAVWMLRVLIAGRPDEIYDIGSRKEVSVAELAAVVAQVAHREFNGDVEISAGHEEVDSLAPEHYVPKGDPPLSLQEHFTLEEQIVRMMRCA